MTTWSNGDVSGSQTLTDADHLYPAHINELRTSVNDKLSGEGIFNVKDYGAKGDGVTDDTAAINAALVYANDTYNTMPIPSVINTLYFPPGSYLITPGGLTPIACNIEAGGSKLVSRTNTDAALITIGFNASNGNSSYNININELEGYDYSAFTSTFYGKAIGFGGVAGEAIEKNIIQVGEIHGFNHALWFDITGSSYHIGETQINVNTILDCLFGIYLDSGNNLGAIESSMIEVNYIAYCKNPIRLLSAGTAVTCQNTIRVNCLELHTTANTQGIALSGATVNQNTIIVDSIFYNSNTDYIIVTNGTAWGNLYQIPGADLTKVSFGADILKMNDKGILYTAAPGRSIVYGPSPAPTAGTWQIGDRYIVNNPTAGNVASYCYTAGGWKAETTLAA